MLSVLEVVADSGVRHHFLAVVHEFGSHFEYIFSVLGDDSFEHGEGRNISRRYLKSERTYFKIKNDQK